MEDYMLFPGKVESWNIFIELLKLEIKDIPLKV
jgi:hypothetical protein